MTGLPVLIVCAVAGGILLWYSRRLLQDARNAAQKDQVIQADGVDAEAEIVNHRHIPDEGVGYFLITYKFTPKNSQSVINETAVSESNFRQLKIGDHIPIRYLPDHPKVVSFGPDVQETFGSVSLKTSATIWDALGILLILMGVAIFIGFGAHDIMISARSAAESMRLSATPDVAQMTATVVMATATVQADQATVTKLQNALASRIVGWKKVTDRVLHRVVPPETDLNMHEVEIDYGYCANNSFYVYIWTSIETNDGIITILDGYGYVDPSSPADCFPQDLSEVSLRNNGKLGENWYAVSGSVIHQTSTGN